MLCFFGGEISCIKKYKKMYASISYEEGEKEEKRRKQQPAPSFFYISFILTFTYLCLCIYFILNFINFIFFQLMQLHEK